MEKINVQSTRQAYKTCFNGFGIIYCQEIKNEWNKFLKKEVIPNITEENLHQKIFEVNRSDKIFNLLEALCCPDLYIGNAYFETRKGQIRIIYDIKLRNKATSPIAITYTLHNRKDIFCTQCKSLKRYCAGIFIKNKMMPGVPEKYRNEVKRIIRNVAFKSTSKRAVTEYTLRMKNTKRTAEMHKNIWKGIQLKHMRNLINKFLRHYNLNLNLIENAPFIQNFMSNIIAKQYGLLPIMCANFFTLSDFVVNYLRRQDLVAVYFAPNGLTVIHPVCLEHIAFGESYDYFTLPVSNIKRAFYMDVQGFLSSVKVSPVYSNPDNRNYFLCLRK